MPADVAGRTAFFDSNVIVYFAAGDVVKADRAEALLQIGGTISVQVLNEVATVARRKMGFDWAEVRGALDTVRALLTVVPLTLDAHRRGLDLAERHKLAIYDAMIVAVALEAGCDTLYSEDMHSGLVVDGRITIVNPFA